MYCVRNIIKGRDWKLLWRKVDSGGIEFYGESGGSQIDVL